MNGLILNVLRDVVVERQGAEGWIEAHDRAGREKRLYMPSSDYPDELVGQLLDAAVEVTDLDRESLLTELGRSLVDECLTIYGVHVCPDWRALELVANLETIVDRACAGNRFTTATPPQIRCAVVGARTVRVSYEPDRGSCHLLAGLLDGIGAHYDEPLAVEQIECAREDGSACTFHVSPAGESSSETTEAGSEADPDSATVEPESTSAVTAADHSRRA